MLVKNYFNNILRANITFICLDKLRRTSKKPDITGKPCAALEQLSALGAFVLRSNPCVPIVFSAIAKKHLGKKLGKC